MELPHSCLGITSNIYFDQFFVLADAVHRNKQKSNAQPTTLVLGKRRQKLQIWFSCQSIRCCETPLQQDNLIQENLIYEYEQDLWQQRRQQIALLEVFDHTAKMQFNEKRAHMFDRFRVINSFNDAHTASRFYKNRPSLKKVSPLISLQSVLNSSASVNSPFCQGKPQRREQLHDANDAKKIKQM